MNNETKEKLVALVESRGGAIRTSEVMAAGFHNVYLSELTDEGALTRIKNGLYVLPEYETVSGFYEIQLALPGSVVCLASALSYYDLTTYEPGEAHVAIRRDDRTVPPEFPPVRLFSFSGARYEVGIVEEEIEGHAVRIYNREKCICDALRFRNVLGENVAYECARNYLASRNRDIDRLVAYATKLRTRRSVELVLRAYL